MFVKKILQINVASNYGSTGRIAESIGLLALQNKWNSYIVHGPRYANPTQLKEFCMETYWGEKLHALRSFCLDEHGLGSRKATLNLVEKMKKLSPDIVHLHNIHGYFINYPILFDYLSTSQVPVVWTLHDCWCMTGHCVYFDSIHCDKWKTHCMNCPQLRTYPKSLFRDNSYNNFELKKKYFLKIRQQLHLVPVSDWLAGLVKQSFLKECSISRIYNGIDLTTFSPIQCTSFPWLDEIRFWILGVASPWSKRKGYDDFIQLRKLLGGDFGLVMVGLTKKQIRQLPEGIVGIERTNKISQLVELYSTVDVFFNPTWEDNFPTTNLEALACGTPVITYRTGGSPEAVTTETGFVVEQGDLQEVVNAINIIRNKGKSNYAEKCRNRAVSHFDKDIAYRQYLDLYNQILTNK